MPILDNDPANLFGPVVRSDRVVFGPERPSAAPANEYADSAQRYQRDPQFHAAVDYLFQMTLSCGFTPGELRQIAAHAALKAEQYATRINHFRSDDR